MKNLLLIFITLSFIQVEAQVDFGDPDLDENLLNSKPYKRMLNYSANRNTTNKNGEWSKWEAWQDAVKSDNKSILDEPWINYGPDTVSGRIISIAFHPWDSQTMLVGSAAGGLWRTTDYGSSWEVLTDHYFTMGIGAVAYNPLNPNSILIASGEGYAVGGEFTAGYGVMISFDGGSSWENTSITATLDQSFAGMDIHWNPNDTSKVCIASSFGVYFSSDGGTTYNYVLDRIGGRIAIDPVNADRLYFTARYYNAPHPGGLYISTNSGESWELTSNNGLPSPDACGYASIVIHPTYNNIIYVSVSRSPVYGSGPLEGLYKSSDFGTTFSEVMTTMDYLCYHPPYQNICQGWFANTIQVSPVDTNKLFAGGCRLWSSEDGGINWEAIDVNPAGNAYAVHPDHHQTIFHPLTGDLIDCHDGGVCYSSDEGLTWTNISDGLVTHQFYSIAFAETDPDVVLGGTQDVGTFSSTTAHTGGWNNDISGDSFGQVIDHTDENTWYGTNFMNVQRMKTVNAGNNWFAINNGTSGADQWRMPIVMHPTENNTLLSSNNNFIYKTTNGGEYWQTVSSYGYIGTLEYDKVNSDLVYAHRLFGSIVYRSTNGGDNWIQLGSSPGNPITDLAADPLSQGTVYASIGSFEDNNQLFVSSDMCNTWSNISNGLPPVPCNSVAVCPFNNQELYVGTDIGVWRSQNGGNSWESFNEGLPAAIVVDDLHYYAPDTSVRIGTYGRGYWRIKTSGSVISSDKQIENQFVRIYPTPANKMVYIETKSSVKKVQLFNLSGQLILDQNTTGKKLEINTSNIQSGIYFIKIFSLDNLITKKLVIE